ncbi:MAG: S8 family serine peptidase [Thermoanaerobaculia bacterium]
MKRSLHITINEGAGDSPRRSPVYAPGYVPNYAPGSTSGNPGSDYVMPPPIDSGGPRNPSDGSDWTSGDPGSDYVMPPPVDSGGPRNPSEGSGWTGGNPGVGYAMSQAGGYGPAVTVTDRDCDCCCGQPSAATAGSTSRPGIAPRDYSGFVIVRTVPGVESRTAENLWALAKELGLEALQAVLELKLEKDGQPAETALRLSAPPAADSDQPPGSLVSWPLIDFPPRSSECRPGRNRAEAIAAIRALEDKARVTSFPPLHSLTAYWRVDLRRHPDRVEEVVERLSRLAVVDLAYREITAVDPGTSTAYGEAFGEDQGYLDDAPVGIGARWAWESLGANPQAVRICDLEQGWNPHHQAFGANLEGVRFYGANRADQEVGEGHHGTAVLGQLAAGAGSYGVKGAATDVGQFVLASHYRSKDEDPAYPFPGTNGHVAAAIVNTLVAPSGATGPKPLLAGDILLLEVQRGLLPTETDAADLDAIRLASALGIIVVEAAGNGGFDLDAYSNSGTGQNLSRLDSHFRDSGAILVGAARAGLPHDRAPFSNYGSRLDCFGWGETVTTCGYGDLSGTAAADYYTNIFSGTSSASPIIAGAAALVQALHEAHAKCRLDPRSMRKILSDPATGTRQGPNVGGFIGVMPDLKGIVRRRLQLVPDVYMRRRVGDDDGSAPGLGEEISSSPDILVWRGKPGKASDRFGEGPRANTPAPGNPIDPDHPDTLYANHKAHLYVRLRNRGGGQGTARVRLFASPAATLITPERWMPIGSIKIPVVNGMGIPQGDTLTVSPAIPVDLPSSGQWPQDPSEWQASVVPAYSFLAVQLPWDEPPLYAPGFESTTGLPPGPPYFDWAEFRSFLRGPGVAWRNVHPVRAAASMTLPFLLAGTPDQARHFDFEVIQRLPAGVEVTLAVPPALAAKLRQRQPWLANGSGALNLPSRPRTALSQVVLAAGACVRAAFHVRITGPNPLLRGHSLAIRQLWRGEEVGRITWWFIDKSNTASL